VPPLDFWGWSPAFEFNLPRLELHQGRFVLTKQYDNGAPVLNKDQKAAKRATRKQERLNRKKGRRYA